MSVQELCRFAQITNQGIECHHPKANIGAVVPTPPKEESEPLVNFHYLNSKQIPLCRLVFLATIQNITIPESQANCPVNKPSHE